MNSLTPIIANGLPTFGAEELDFEFSYNITGDLYVLFDEDTRESGGETFVSNVRSAEVWGLHLGGNVVLTRDQLVAISSEARVAGIETTFAEKRAEQ